MGRPDDLTVTVDAIMIDDERDASAKLVDIIGRSRN